LDGLQGRPGWPVHRADRLSPATLNRSSQQSRSTSGRARDATRGVMPLRTEDEQIQIATEGEADSRREVGDAAISNSDRTLEREARRNAALKGRKTLGKEGRSDAMALRSQTMGQEALSKAAERGWVTRRKRQAAAASLSVAGQTPPTPTSASPSVSDAAHLAPVPAALTTPTVQPLAIAPAASFVGPGGNQLLTAASRSL
jgi:hypothetical protein